MRVSRKGAKKIYLQQAIGSIGPDCVIHPTVQLGGQGFGIERDEKGMPVDFKHIGNIIIGKDVHIGENSNVHRGSLGSTIIEDHCRIDALVHIGHNAHIGKATFIVAGSVIGGSTKIGEKSWIGENATTREGITIGKQVIVGANAYVANDVPDRDIVGGIPAVSIKDKVKLTKAKRFSMVGY